MGSLDTPEAISSFGRVLLSTGIWQLSTQALYMQQHYYANCELYLPIYNKYCSLDSPFEGTANWAEFVSSFQSFITESNLYSFLLEGAQSA